MPLVNKTYPVVSQAGGASTRPLSDNPSRKSLIIQNTGGNPGQVRFGAANQGPGADLTFIAGQMERWDQPGTCPLESVNLSAVLGTTWCIVEGRS